MRPLDKTSGAFRRSLRLCVAGIAGVSVVLASGCSHTGSAAAVDRATPVVHIPGPDPETYPGGRALLSGAKVPKALAKPSPSEVIHEFPETTIDRQISTFADREIKVGVYGDPKAKRTIALAGGSHAEMWISALDIIGKRNDFRVETYLKMGCPLSTDPNPFTLEWQPYPECYDWSIRVLSQLEHDQPDAVFTTSTRPVFNGTGDEVRPAYVEAFDRLMAAGIPIVGIRDTPWPRKADYFIDTPICLMSGGDAISCGSPRDVVLSPIDPALSLEAGRPLFHSIDLTDGFCSSDSCPAIVGNVIVYKDQHHVSATFVRSLIDELEKRLKAELPWIGSSK